MPLHERQQAALAPFLLKFSEGLLAMRRPESCSAVLQAVRASNARREEAEQSCRSEGRAEADCGAGVSFLGATAEESARAAAEVCVWWPGVAGRFWVGGGDPDVTSFFRVV